MLFFNGYPFFFSLYNEKEVERMRNFTEEEKLYIKRMSMTPRRLRRKLLSIEFTKNHDKYDEAAERYLNGDDDAILELKQYYRRFSVLQSIPL
jgi:hypothetical protein